MSVYVEHGLPCTTPRVEHHAVARVSDPFIRSDRSGLEQDLGDQARICLRQIDRSRVMLLGDDEHVRRRLRVDVTKSQCPRPIPDDGGRHIPRDDLAEQTVAIHDPLPLTAIAARSWSRTFPRFESHGSRPAPRRVARSQGPTAYEASR